MLLNQDKTTTVLLVLVLLSLIVVINLNYSNCKTNNEVFLEDIEKISK